MKYNRTLSHGNVADYELINELHAKHSHDKPVHRPAQSLFTTSSGFTNFRGLINLGLFLLTISSLRMALENVMKYGIVMDPLSWLRFILETREKYFAIGLLVCSNVFVIFALYLERAVVKGLISGWFALVATIWNLFCVLTFPTAVILSLDFNPLFSAPVLSVYTVIFLKLWSYAAVNRWCRKAYFEEKHYSSTAILNRLVEYAKRERLSNTGDGSTPQNSDAVIGNHSDDTGNSHAEVPNEGDLEEVLKSTRKRPTDSMEQNSRSDVLPGQFRTRTHSSVQEFNVNLAARGSFLDALEDENIPSLQKYDIKLNRFISYPQNLTFSDIYYFILAPTLCYELNFPRTPFIRKQFLAKRLFELIFLPQLILCLIQQWILPILNNSVASIMESNFSQLVERCLKLAIPNHLIWLLFFYATFHSLLNVIGELLRFGDRFFYSDWWNAETVPSFWSKWNIPVHRFARRHIYLPLIDLGLSRSQAGMVVFFISALLHEFLVSVPLKMPRMWAFLGMFCQLPYYYFVSLLIPPGGTCGNLAVWITLIIGQPMAILFYFHDYYIMHYTNN